MTRRGDVSSLLNSNPRCPDGSVAVVVVPRSARVDVHAFSTTSGGITGAS